MSNAPIARALCVIGLLCAVNAPAATQTLQASRLAGSGALGIADGDPGTASFLMPAQVAIGNDGTVFVADLAAQRVRAVSAAGAVRTVAGGGAVAASTTWVVGGYADGPAADARFNRPTGIAVAADGTLYVADAGNHCIRVIRRGVVATLAGNASAAGTTDGPAATARFDSPRELALDTDGTLYVADWGAGIRRIRRDGSVSTIAFAGATIDRPTGVAIGRSGPFVKLFVADAAGLVRADLTGAKAERFDAFPAEDAATHERYPLSSDVQLGTPHAIAAFSVSDVVYTDLRDSSVKYLLLASYERALGPTPREDAMTTGGGGDLDASGATYQSPMGVAVDAKGGVVVADTGNRRLVRFAPFDRGSIGGDPLEQLTFPKNAYRIGYVGSSYTWWGSLAADSIAGDLESDLATAIGGKTAVARAFHETQLPAEFDLIDGLLAPGAVDCVVLQIAPVDPYVYHLGADPARWGPVVRARLTKSIAALRTAKIPVLLVLNPSPTTFGPAESPYLYNQELASDATDYDAEHAALLAIMDASGAPVLDLYPLFRAAIAAPDHKALFNTADPHYTPYGRAFVAKAVADRLRAMHPWSTP